MEKIKVFFKEKNFRKLGNRFYKKVNDAFFVVSFYKAKFHSHWCIETGVFFSKGDEPKLDYTKEYNCHYRASYSKYTNSNNPDDVYFPKENFDEDRIIEYFEINIIPRIENICSIDYILKDTSDVGYKDSIFHLSRFIEPDFIKYLKEIRSKKELS